MIYKKKLNSVETRAHDHRPCGVLMWAGNGDPRGVRFIGEEWSRYPRDLVRGLTRVCCSEGVVGRVHFRDGIVSRIAKTSSIWGRAFASGFTQVIARVAAMHAPFRGYWPPNLVSIIRNILRFLSSKWDFAHSTSFCSTPTFVLSTARRPVSSSSKTTPKLYTSHFEVNRPANKKTIWIKCTLAQENELSGCIIPNVINVK